jgi:hypothetical protein
MAISFAGVAYAATASLKGRPKDSRGEVTIGRRQSPEERLPRHPSSDAKGNLIEKDIGHIALKAGDRKNVKVKLREDPKAGEKLWAMLDEDTGTTCLSVRDSWQGQCRHALQGQWQSCRAGVQNASEAVNRRRLGAYCPERPPLVRFPHDVRRSKTHAEGARRARFGHHRKAAALAGAGLFAGGTRAVATDLQAAQLAIAPNLEAINIDERAPHARSMIAKEIGALGERFRLWIVAIDRKYQSNAMRTARSRHRHLGLR